MDLLIREAQPADAVQLIEYVQRLSEEPGINIGLGPGEFNYSVEEEQKFLADYAASDNSVFLLADIGGKIVGQLDCRGGRRAATRHAVTLGMSVERAWRGKGIGDFLMARAIEWARGTGIVHRMELAVFMRNQVAIHLYMKHGFLVEGHRRKVVYREGEYRDDYIMALLL